MQKFDTSSTGPFPISDKQKLQRFLILGTAGGTFYASENKLSKDFIHDLNRMIAYKEGGQMVLSTLLDVRKNNRAYKQDPTLFVLAFLLSKGDPETKAAAGAAFNDIVQTGTQLFTVVEYLDGMRGWGESMRRPIANWYTSKDPHALAYQLCKYQQRNGWSHRDVVKLSHPKAGKDNAISDLLGFAVGKKKIKDGLVSIFSMLREEAVSEKFVIESVEKFGITFEMIPDELKTPAVWTALEKNMQLIALIRNLSLMTRLGIYDPWDVNTYQGAIDRLTHEGFIKRSRVHPMQFLAASTTYARGQGMRSTWTPIPRIIDALSDGFKKAFVNVEATNKRIIAGIDLSGSMGASSVVGVEGLSSAEAVSAMATVLLGTEPNTMCVGYSSVEKKIDLTPGITLRAVSAEVRAKIGGNTDCAIPVKVALEKKIVVDGFIIFTDEQSNFGPMKVGEAFKKYQETINPDAKCVFITACMSNITVAAPDNKDMISIAGFSPDTLSISIDFINGKI
jgi:60 kDa SS-A/Ro ribonucleoprotein